MSKSLRLAKADWMREKKRRIACEKRLKIVLGALELAWSHLQRGSQQDWQKQIVDAIEMARSK